MSPWSLSTLIGTVRSPSLVSPVKGLLNPLTRHSAVRQPPEKSPAEKRLLKHEVSEGESVAYTVSINTLSQHPAKAGGT